jgi:hypothetical protein
MLRLSRCLVIATSMFLVGLNGTARAGDIDKFVPSDTELYLAFNFRQIFDAGLVRPHLDKIKEALLQSDDLRRTVESLGFDPFRDLDSVIVAGAGGESPDRGLLIIHGRFNVEKFQAKAREVAEQESGVLKIETVDGRQLYQVTAPGQPKPAFVALIDAGTLVASGSRDVIIGAFATGGGKQVSLANHEMESLLEHLDATHSVSIAGLGSAIAKNLPQAEKIRNVAGGISIGDDFRIDLTIECTDEASGTALAKELSGGIEQGRNLVSFMAQNQKDLAPLVEVINAIKIKPEGARVSIAGHVTREMIDKLQAKP